MLRGINRYVIEINDPESSFFDKVILFVKPEYGEDDSEKLKKEGEKLIDLSELKLSSYPIKKGNKSGSMFWPVLGSTIFLLIFAFLAFFNAF